MTPDKISRHVTSDRLAWIERMLGDIRYELISSNKRWWG